MLRGVASILVVLYHMTSNYSEIFGQPFLHNVFNFGGSGVDVFFVLSGFIIAYANNNFVARPAKTVTFLKRRFIRIFPIYWVIITLFLTIQLLFPFYYKSHFELGAANLISTYLLLPGHAMINGVSWSLTNELFFYFLFMLAIIIPERKIAVYILTAYFILLLVVAISGLDITAGNNYMGLLLFPMNIEFLLGVFVFLIAEKIPGKLVWPLLLAGIALFLTGAFIYNNNIHILYSQANMVLNRVLLFGLPSFLIISALVKMELNKTIQLNRIFLYLGDASYSIYLIHLPLVVAFYKVIARFGINNAWLMALLNCLLFVAICFIGVLCFLKIEKPLIKKLNRLLPEKKLA
jgi:peptidoglycan/LPS O-acetylase OafA/YrhL